MLINDSGFNNDDFDQIFSPDYHWISYYTISLPKRDDLKNVTCINYAGDFVQNDNLDK